MCKGSWRAKRDCDGGEAAWSLSGRENAALSKPAAPVGSLSLMRPLVPHPQGCILSLRGPGGAVAIRTLCRRNPKPSLPWACFASGGPLSCPVKKWAKETAAPHRNSAPVGRRPLTPPYRNVDILRRPVDVKAAARGLAALRPYTIALCRRADVGICPYGFFFFSCALKPFRLWCSVG